MERRDYLFNTEDTGEFNAALNCVGFNLQEIRRRDCLEQTVQHEFRHYWQKSQGFLEPWNILTKAEKDQAIQFLIHPLEEDARYFSLYPRLGKHTEIVLSVEPSEVLRALNSNILRIKVRRKIVRVIQDVLLH